MAIFHMGFQSVPKTVIVVEDTIPTGVYQVRSVGAGTTATNRTYTWDGDLGVWRYSSTYKIYHDGTKWLLSSFSEVYNYYSNTGGDANNLPMTGWAVETGGYQPPTVEAITIATGITPVYVVAAGSTSVNGLYNWDSTLWRNVANTCTIEYSVDFTAWLIKEGTVIKYMRTSVNGNDVPKFDWTINAGIGASPAPSISDTAP